MNTIKVLLVMLMCTIVMGCLSQQAHEQAMEELAMTHQNAAQEVERLQQDVQDREAAVVQLEETLRENDKTVVQLEEANKDLEAAIEVQEQIKEKNLKALKKELQALYSEVAGLGNFPEAKRANFSLRSLQWAKSLTSSSSVLAKMFDLILSEALNSSAFVVS